ncbi:MAG: M20 family metallopeptidase [Anaerolineae bacterium]|nr:M20 family metallopeptidase [Anaerolineae bacterium]
MSDFLEYFDARTPDMIALVRRLAEFESPSDNKPYVDQLSAYVAGLCRELGAAVTIHPRETVGDIVFATWHNDAPGKPILFLAHMDTVWPVGTINEMLLREENGILYGPGVADMKSGIVVLLAAIRGLHERGELPERPIWALFTTDEETRSQHSRDLICEKAKDAGLVLVLEPAAEGEAIKSWRKGIGNYTVQTKGRASHAGQAPEAGINAVIEVAHQALALHKLNDLPNGTSVSVTMVQGGIATNVIPPTATLQVDVRFLKAAEAGRVNTAIKGLTPVLPGAEVIVEGDIDRGPMERNEQMVRVVNQVKAIAASLGIDQREDGSGGASDGNFTAAMGIPTLDGLGPEGLGLHATHEQITIRSLHRRAALLAKMLLDWDMAQV